jgi:hypothetical protein
VCTTQLVCPPDSVTLSSLSSHAMLSPLSTPPSSFFRHLLAVDKEEPSVFQAISLASDLPPYFSFARYCSTWYFSTSLSTESFSILTNLLCKSRWQDPCPTQHERVSLLECCWNPLRSKLVLDYFSWSLSIDCFFLKSRFTKIHIYS